MSTNGSPTEQPDNPAQLAAQLAALFPPEVVAAELLGNAPAAVLTAEEGDFIGHCAQKRIEDFTAGRACAHRALHELGITGFSLLSASDRVPIWPAGIVGSITHTAGYRAAVVARERDLSSLGLDCESIAAVNEELWPQICTASELERVRGLAVADRSRQAALLFAAKEAFYKCQYPLTGQWVGFEDVVIEPAAWPAAAGAFRVLPQKALGLGSRVIAGLTARFQFCADRVVAGVTAHHHH